MGIVNALVASILNFIYSFLNVSPKQTTTGLELNSILLHCNSAGNSSLSSINNENEGKLYTYSSR
jgi:hypothetical protein